MSWKKLRSWFFFYEFHTLHKKPRAKIEVWQLRKLKLLISHLQRNIPLYRELLDVAQIQPEDIVSLDTLEKLPMMNKETFRGRRVEDYIDTSHQPVGSWVTTSGTSGVLFAPLRRAVAKMPRYSDSLRYRFLMEERPWRWDATWAKMAHVRVLRLPRENSITVYVNDLLSNPMIALRQLAEFQPYIIEAHASLLFELARQARIHGLKLRPRYAISASERLLPASRSFVEEEFECKVFVRYGLEEFGTVGLECIQHDGFHINAESFIVEVVDRDGKRLPDGTRGSVLITDLYNYEMPFVRYNTGDRGRLTWERCACGLETPRLWFEGRYSAFLSFKQRQYHQFEFSEIMQLFTPHVFQYQIAKKSDTAMVVRLIPGPSYTSSVEAEMKEQFRKIMETVDVQIEQVSHISRLPRGKSQIVADESVDQSLRSASER